MMQKKFFQYYKNELKNGLSLKTIFDEFKKKF